MRVLLKRPPRWYFATLRRSSLRYGIDGDDVALRGSAVRSASARNLASTRSQLRYARGLVMSTSPPLPKVPPKPKTPGPKSSDGDAPWATGPGEILQHAMRLLSKDSDSNRRLAMILIDNAVELMLKTYLGLPTRVTGIKIPRDKFREISESFPKLLDAIEEHADDRLAGIDLGQVEWYHRLRNELYHQGNGLTVERQKVDVYAELAKLLFKNLFGTEIRVDEDAAMELLGSFMAAWQRVERALNRVGMLTSRGFVGSLVSAKGTNLGGDASLVEDVREMRKFRNEVVHGQVERTAITRQTVTRLEQIAARIEALPPTTE